MKQYPSIPGAGAHGVIMGLPCIGFVKHDGSLIRCEWQPKKGWHQFGTKHTLFDRRHPEFGAAIEVFHQKYASALEEVIRKEKYLRDAREITAFCEFFGPFSFSGQHDPNHPAVQMGGCKGSNDPKDMVLFDVNVHKKGLMVARDFINIFGHLPIAQVVYEGNLNASFIQAVREGQYPVFEGVVCKGCNGKAPHGWWAAKIKTNAYRAELERRFAADWEEGWE